jgi:hypothetical protein
MKTLPALLLFPLLALAQVEEMKTPGIYGVTASLSQANIGLVFRNV